MEDRLNINSVNLHHRFLAGVSWMYNLASHKVKIIADPFVIMEATHI